MRPGLVICALALFPLAIGACVDRSDKAPVRSLDVDVEGPRADDLLRTALTADTPPDGLQSLRHWKHLQALYSQRDSRALWLDRDGLSRRGEEALEVLAAGAEDGLAELDPTVGELEEQLLRMRERDEASTSELAVIELRLSDAVVQRLIDVQWGQLDSGEVGWSRRSRSEKSDPPLEVLANSGSARDALEAARPPHVEYAALRESLREHRELLREGGWPLVEPGPTLKPGMRDPRVVTLRQRLGASGDGPHRPPEHDADLFDETVTEAVKAFQRRHGLPDDGEVGRRTLDALRVPVEKRIAQLEANLERWRWQPRELGDRHLWVNLPTYDLVARENGEERLRMRVVIGALEWQTPVLRDEVQAIWTNPGWTVPRRMLEKELVPRIQEDPAVAAELGLQVVAPDGAPVDPATVDWSQAGSRDFPYKLSQDAGPKNPLGRFKFELPNRLNIYLHDTPERRAFDRLERSLSHGCIRVEDAPALARFLVGSAEHVGRLDEAMTEDKTLRLALDSPVPVHFAYFTAWRDAEGRTQFRDDVYRRERAMVQALLERKRDAERSMAKANVKTLPARGGVGGAGD